VLKKSITYKNPFDEDEEFTEDHYFHLQESDIVELQVQYKAGWIETMTKYIADGDNEKILEALKNVILKSYGKRSENGRIHIKNDHTRRILGNGSVFSFAHGVTSEYRLDDQILQRNRTQGISDPKVTNLSVVPDEPPRVITPKELEV
jgi:hypothetical protein